MFARNFLTELARRYELSTDQESAFVALFTRSDDNDLAAADTLKISASAFRTRMTGVYKKFSISGQGAGKSNKLKNFLHQEDSKRSSSQTVSKSEEIDLDVLVQEVRDKVSASIQKRCGTMRVLDMEQPITIDSIYTSVNILEKISRNQRRSIEELQDGCRGENFDRFILGKKRERIPALKAVERHDKLLILGKPGAGKTTFLKWLALQCNGGKFNQNRVPLFVTLKEFAEAEGQPDLLSFIAKQLTECGIENGLVVGEKILQAGRSIVLLDGLDEVKAQDHDRVLNTIHQTAEKFDASQFVITCRIAAKEYIFEQWCRAELGMTAWKFDPAINRLVSIQLVLDRTKISTSRNRAIIMSKWQFWIDRGGTFTDVITQCPDGEILVNKLLSENLRRHEDSQVYS
jgi:hypothetical protein